MRNDRIDLHMLRAMMPLILLCVFTASSRGSQFYPVLEQDIASANLVVRARLTSIQPLPDKASAAAETTVSIWELSVLETLKGPPTQTLRLNTGNVPFVTPALLAEGRVGEEYLLILLTAPLPPSTDGTDPDAAGAFYMLIDGWPVGRKLQPGEKRFYTRTADLRAIVDPEDLLSTTRQLCVDEPQHFGTTVIVVNTPRRPPKVYSIPLDVKTERVAEAWANASDPDSRTWALDYFYACGPELRPLSAEAILRRMLSDPSVRDVGAGPMSGRYFFIRAQAAEVLIKWGAEFRQPVVEEPLTRYSQLGPAGTWRTLGLVAVAIACGVVWRARRRPRRTWAAGSFAPPAQWWRPSCLQAMWLCIAVLTTCIWVRSRHTTDEVVLDALGRHRLASFGGALQYSLVPHWAGPARLAIGRFDPKPAGAEHPLSLDKQGGSFSKIRVEYWPSTSSEAWSAQNVRVIFRTQFARGLTYDVTGTTRDFFGIRVPYRYLILVFALLAVPWRRLLRRVTRYPPGHCSGCGYDLRATPDRCPECGRLVGPRRGETVSQP